MLGGRVELAMDGYARVALGAGTVHLATASPGTPDKPGVALAPPPAGGVVHGELVLAVEDCRRVHAELVARGARFLAPPGEPPWGGEVRAFLRDPDGHLVELSQTR